MPTAVPNDPVATALWREARTGERLVSWLRAALLLVSYWREPIEFFSRDRPFPASFLIIDTALVLACIAWVVMIERVPYRTGFSLVSVALDLTIWVTTSINVVLLSPRLAVHTLCGGTATGLIIYFIIAAAALRQSPVAALAAAVLAVPVYAAVIAVARHGIGPNDLPTIMASAADGTRWRSRAIVTLFVGAIAYLAARNGQRMAREAALEHMEQDRVRGVFGRYVDPVIARAVLGGLSHAETREVTVLFTDLRGFTSISEKLPPVKVLEMLNAHYSAIVPCVHAEGGTVNKFVGDAIMATFGAPLPLEDHAVRAVRAAKSMIAAMDALNTHWAASGGPSLKMGIGIATGPVVVGSLGAAERIEYAVIGDTVNVASRLEGLTKELGAPVVLSSATRAQLGASEATQSLGSAAVRGKEQPLEVFGLA